MYRLVKEFAETSKRQILLELRNGSKSVNEIVEVTGLKQPNVSNHLSKLRSKKIVKSTKVGRQVYYSLSGPEIEAALAGLLQKKPAILVPLSDLEATAKLYARAAVAGDESTCKQLIDSLIEQGVPFVQIYQNVLASAMKFVGKWYEVEAIDIGQEHLASAMTERMMSRIIHYSAPVKSVGHTAIVGCVAGNHHTIGARMISDFLKLSGWRVLFLGANTPLESFLSTIKDHDPKLVLVSVAFESDRPEALRVISKLSNDIRKNNAFQIGVGGQQCAFNPHEFTEKGADFICTNLLIFADEILPNLV